MEEQGTTHPTIWAMESVIGHGGATGSGQWSREQHTGEQDWRSLSPYKGVSPNPTRAGMVMDKLSKPFSRVQDAQQKHNSM